MFCFTPATLLLATGGLLAASDATPKATPRPDDPAAVAELQKLGAQIEKDESGVVRGLVFGGAKATDTTLAHLKGLHSLQRLQMSCIVKVTDEGLANLAGLSELRSLYLGFSEITDRGLVHLKRLQNLEKLAFSTIKANITDAGLEHLKGLNRLRELRLGAARVTEAGVTELQNALPNCKIMWKQSAKDERQCPAASDRPGDAAAESPTAARVARRSFLGIQEHLRALPGVSATALQRLARCLRRLRLLHCMLAGVDLRPPTVEVPDVAA